MALLPWLFNPDWSNGMTERLEWLTDILTSPAGVEQCRALRRRPRRSWSASFIVNGPERTRLTLQLARNGAQSWLMPVWPDAAWVYDLTTGQQVVTCDPTGRDYYVGGQVIFWNGQDSETLTIATVNPTWLTFTTKLTRDWPAAQMAPARAARLVDMPPLKKLTDDLMTLDTTFTVTEDCYVASATPATVWKTYPVMTEEPDDSQELTAQYQRLLLTLDNNVNYPQLTDTAQMPFIVQSYSWLLAGAKKKADWRAWRYLLRGRQGRVWLPSFNRDLLLAGDIAAGNSLLIVAAGLAPYGDFTVAGQRDIQIAGTAGEFWHARITAALPAGGDTEILTLEEPLPDIPASRVARVSFMVLSRQDDDAAELKYATDTDGTATASMVFKGVYE